MTENANILLCPHCGVEGEFTVAWQEAVSRGGLALQQARVLRCRHCGRHVFELTDFEPEASVPYSNPHETFLPSLRAARTRFYPGALARIPGVPDEMWAAYHAAWEMAQSGRVGSAEAAGLLCRKTLEAVAEDQGGRGRSLQQKLRSLARQGALPEVMRKASDMVRGMGNEAVHHSLAPDHLGRLLDLTRAVLVWYYELPALLGEAA